MTSMLLCTPISKVTHSYRGDVVSCLFYGDVDSSGRVTYENTIKASWWVSLQSRRHYLTVRIDSHNGASVIPQMPIRVRKDMLIDGTVDSIVVAPTGPVYTWNSGTRYVHTDGPGTFWLNMYNVTVYDSRRGKTYSIAGSQSTPRFKCYKTAPCKFTQ